MVIEIFGIVIGLLITIGGVYYWVTDGKKDVEFKKISIITVVIGLLITGGFAVEIFLQL